MKNDTVGTGKENNKRKGRKNGKLEQKCITREDEMQKKRLEWKQKK